MAYEPSLAESWGQRERQRAYRVTRRAVLAWAGLRLLSLPLLLWFGFTKAHDQVEGDLKIPGLQWVALFGILVVGPLMVVAAVWADVAAAISSPVVVLAGELLRKKPELYEKESFSELGREKNALLDVFLAEELHRDGSVRPRPENLGCTSVRIRRRLRRSLREGEGVALLGGANGRIFAKRAGDAVVLRMTRTYRP